MNTKKMRRLLCLLLSVGMVLPATVVNAAEIGKIDEDVVTESVQDDDDFLVSPFTPEETSYMLSTGSVDMNAQHREFTQEEYDSIPCEGEEIDITPESGMLGDYKLIDLNINGEKTSLRLEEKGNNGFDGQFTVQSRGYLSFLFPEFRDSQGNRANRTRIEVFNAAGNRIWRCLFQKDDELTPDNQYSGRIPVNPGYYKVTFRVEFDGPMQGDSENMDMVFNFHPMETLVTLPSNSPQDATVINSVPYNCPIDEMYLILHGGREPMQSPYTTFMKIRNNSGDTNTDVIYFTNMDAVQNNDLSIELHHATNESVIYDLKSELKQEELRPGDDQPRWSCSLRNKPSGDYYLIISGDSAIQQKMRVSVENEEYTAPGSKPSPSPEPSPNPEPSPSPEPSPNPDPLPTVVPTKTPKPIAPYSKEPTKRFTDVQVGKWYSKSDGPIAYVIANGIMNGTGDGTTFEPEGNCTREMFVQILYNSEGKPGAGPSNPFGDVKKSWYYDAVTWAVANGVTTGTSATTFGVGGIVTREQLAQFLMNYAKKRGFDTTARADVSNFPDNAQISGWANEAISWANANGIVNGKKKDGVNFLDPKGNATRAEVAQMIMGFQKKFGK